MVMGRVHYLKKRYPFQWMMSIVKQFTGVMGHPELTKKLISARTYYARTLA